jgi:RNA polymerase sigma-70 factor (ECF subfamily)
MARFGVTAHMTPHCACETWPVAGAAAGVASAIVAAGSSMLTAAAVAGPVTTPDPESSIVLVERVRNGDAEALDHLFSRYLVRLKRWAHGRLPPYARAMDNTEDIVQSGIVRVLANIANFRPQRPGGFHALLRTAVRCEIIDKIRAAGRRPLGVELEDDLPSALPSPYELALEQEDRDIYEEALEQLSEDDRELVIGRLEWGMEYEELGASLPRPRTRDATRVAARRAVEKLAHIMMRLRQGSAEATQS